MQKGFLSSHRVWTTERRLRHCEFLPRASNKRDMNFMNFHLFAQRFPKKLLNFEDGKKEGNRLDLGTG